MPIRKAALAHKLGIVDSSYVEKEKEKQQQIREVQRQRNTAQAERRKQQQTSSVADRLRQQSIADSVFAEIGTPKLPGLTEETRSQIDYSTALARQLEAAKAERDRLQQQRSQHIDSLTADPAAAAGDSAGHSLDQRLKASQAAVDQLEDQLTTSEGLLEISQLPEEDRQLIQQFASLRSQAYPHAVARQLHDKGYSNDEINRLAEIYTRNMNAQIAEKRRSDAAQMAKERPFLSNLLSLGASAVGGVSGTLNALGETINRTLHGSEYNTLDPNLPGYAPSDFAAGVRGQTAQDIEKAIDNEMLGKTASAVYSGAASAVDNLIRIGVGAATGSAYASLGLAAASSFQDGVQSASQRGGDPAQALTYGVANAGLEVITEKIPLDELFKAGTPKNWAQLFTNAAKQAGIEVITEEANFVGGLLADAAIMQEKSEFNTTVNDLVSSGLTYEEAKKQAWEGLFWQAYETAVSSGISGGIVSGGASAFNVIQNGGFPAAQQPVSQRQAEEIVQPEADVAPAPEALSEPVTTEDKVAAAVDTMFDAFGVDRQTGELTANAPAVEETVDPVESSAYNDPRAVTGSAGVTYSDANSPVNFRYAIVPAETLVSSHDEYGNVNPAYPAELQPRDRTRVSSVTQIAGMSRSLNPELLAESPTAQNGSPIVRADGTVVSGNARTQAILTAYKNAGAEGYRSYIVENAARFGIDPAAVPDNPVLVRVLDSDSDLAALASTLNSSTVSGYSATERAMDDASRIGGALKGATTGYEQSAGRELYPGRDADGIENAAGGRRDAAAQPLASERDSVEDNRSIPEDHAGTPGSVTTDNGEAVGAASRDFSGLEAYNDLLTDDNVQPSRATDAKHEEVPIRDGKGQRVSEFAHNAMNSEVISARDVDTLKQLIQEGAFGAEVQHMDDVHRAAVERIKARGDSASVHAITRDVANGKADEHTIAEAQVLFAMYTNRKSTHAQNMASELLLDLSEMSRQAGRQLNMFKLLRRQTPEGRLISMRKSVERMTEQINESRSAKNQVKPEIPPELEVEYVNAETEEEQKVVVDKIQQSIADQMPSTPLEMWNALRYVNMLGNFKTQGRNIAGNVGMSAVADFKNLIGASLEALAVKGGADIERTKSAFVSRDLLDKAKADFANVENDVMGSPKYGDWEGSDFARGVQNKRRIFTSKNQTIDKLLKPLEAYRTVTEWAMERGDSIFSKSAYAKALAGYLKANGVTAETFETADPALMERARKYAIKEAQEATFRDDNTISTWIGKLGRKKTTPKAVRILSEGVMPFRKTPANVLVRAEEYSPLGLINTAVTAAKAAKSGGEINGTDVINSLAKSLTGSAIFALGMWLRNLGWISGAEDEDEDQAQFDKETGYQPYSLVLPNGGTFTLDWLTPAALPLFMGAQLMDLIDDNGLEAKDLESALLSIADPMLKMSMLQGINDTLDNIKYTDNNLGQFAINAMVSYLTQGLTNTFLGQVERSFEEERTTTYVDADSPLPAWLQRALGSASQKIPFWDYQQTPYVDSTGETEKYDRRLSWIENLFLPGYYDARTVTANQEELQRIADATGETGILTNDTPKSFTAGGETVNLTADQWVRMAQAKGQLSQSLLSQAFQSEDYALLSDEERAKMVQSIYDYAGEKARMDTLGDNAPGFSAAWMKGIEGKEVETILARAVLDASGLPESGYAAAKEAGYTLDEMKQISGKVREELEGIEDRDDFDTYRAVLNAAGDENAADWLRVYGMSESRLESMEAAGKRNISARDYLDAAEAESGVDKSFSAITEAWRNGEEPDIAQLSAAYDQFAALSVESRTFITSNATGRVKAYLKARAAGTSDAAFTDLYEVYYNLDGKPAQNATDWAVALDKAVAGQKITKAQRGILWDNLGVWEQVRQNADTYHKIYDAGSSAGVSVGLAEELTSVITNLNPESGKKSVRDIQKFESVVDFPGLSTSAEEAVLEAYLDEGQMKRYNSMTDRGYSAEEYVAAYRAYLDGDKKVGKVQDIMDALGISYAEALTIYKLYNG